MNPIETQLMNYLDPKDLCKRYSALKASRSTWESRWQSIQDQVFPDYRDYMSKTQVSPPQTSKIRNHSGLVAGLINKVVSGITSQSSDPSVKWMDLRFGMSNFDDLKPAKDWLQQCEEVLYSVLADPDSGFYSSNLAFHLDWFTIGTACREIVIRKDNGQIHFNCVPMSDIFIETSGFGDISSVFRRFSLSATQAVSMWGQALHHSIQENASKENSSMMKKKYEFVEAVIANPIQNIIPMQWVACVIDVQNKMIVDVGFHARNPYVVSRFLIAPNEAYGRSYVWNAMPDIKAINMVTKLIMQSIDFAVFPVTLVQDSISLPQHPITPGMFIQGLDINGRPQFQQMQFGGNIQIAMQFLQQKLQDLNDALLAQDLFPIDSPQMTATEVTERKIQAASRIRPLLVILENEDLNNTVKRTLKLLEQTGQLPPFPYDECKIDPAQLQDPILSLRVTFSGQMYHMQKLQDIQNNDLLLQKAVQLAQISQDALDYLNTDKLLVAASKTYNVSPSIVRSDETVQQIREQRAKQQQEAQMAQMQAQQISNYVNLMKAGINE
jgi:hypothetical protein